MASVLMPMRSLLVNGSHRFATCWKIERADGVLFYFTDHNEYLTIGSETYSPGGSFSSSARQRREGTDPQNVEIRGYLDAASITEDDLRSGKYRGAKITEFTVDWKFPFAGTFSKNTYYVDEVTFTNEVWTAKISGVSILLQRKKGRIHSRSCGWAFGDSDCGVSLAGVTQIGKSVSSVTTSRLSFSGNHTSGTDDYYADGVIKWTSGPNSGLENDIKTSSGTSITLHQMTPFEISIGNQYEIHPGCDGTVDKCKSYNNFLRFGGFPFMPGNDAYLSTP